MGFAYVEPTIEQLNAQLNTYTIDGTTHIPFEPSPAEIAAAIQQPVLQDISAWDGYAAQVQMVTEPTYAEQQPLLNLAPKPTMPMPSPPPASSYTEQDVVEAFQVGFVLGRSGV